MWRNHMTVILNVVMDIFCIIAFERDMIYQIIAIIDGDLDKQNQWNSMFLNGFDLKISITLILLNNLQC